MLSAFCFEDAGRAYGISPVLLENIAKVESNLNPKAMHKNYNGSYDIGLMQINSFWIKIFNLNTDELLNNPCANTMVGAHVLRQCIDKHGYTWEAVGCYNAMNRGKRINYAWKVFSKLKEEGDKQTASNQRPAVRIQNPSLFFSVRDEAEVDRGIIP